MKSNNPQNKPYLISLTSYIHGLKENYERTLFKLKGSVIPIQVGFSPYPEIHKDIKALTICGAYPGNVSRFDYFPKGFKDDDMIIFTDSADVIFQCPIPKLDKEFIYIAPEFTNWNSEGNYWNQFLDKYNCHELDGKPIFCMGVWAMSYKKVKDLLQYIKLNRYRFGEWNKQTKLCLIFGWINIHHLLITNYFLLYMMVILKVK